MTTIFEAAKEVLDEGLAKGTLLSKQANDASAATKEAPHPDNHSLAAWKHREAGHFHQRVAQKYASTDRKRFIHHMRLGIDHEEKAMYHHSLGTPSKINT